MAREQLATARLGEAQDMFEVRERGCESTRDGGIERPSNSAEKQDASDARPDLEGPVGDVLMGDPISREVEKQPERQRPASRSDERAPGRACGHV
jgi:hypothetical protein